MIVFCLALARCTSIVRSAHCVSLWCCEFSIIELILCPFDTVTSFRFSEVSILLLLTRELHRKSFGIRMRETKANRRANNNRWMAIVGQWHSIKRCISTSIGLGTKWRRFSKINSYKWALRAHPWRLEKIDSIFWFYGNECGAKRASGESSNLNWKRKQSPQMFIAFIHIWFRNKNKHPRERKVQTKDPTEMEKKFHVLLWISSTEVRTFCRIALRRH